MMHGMVPPQPSADRAHPYPIVEMHELQQPQRTGWFGLKGRVRTDLVRPKQGHYRLVYKVDNRYVLDNMSLGGDDDKVIRASQVTVVDMGRHTPVEVVFTVASKDHSEFTIVVTFVCAVEDAVAVVEGGITDPQAILLTYLKAHDEYSLLGTGFAISEVNHAREYIEAKLRAYSTVDEPYIQGMSVTMAGVDVRTPQEESARAKAQRDLRNRFAVESERVDLDGELENQRQRGRHGLHLAEQRNQQEIDFNGNRYRRLSEREEQEHVIAKEDLDLQARLNRQGLTEDYRNERLLRAAEMLQHDPVRALELAYLAGEISPEKLAAGLAANRDRTLAIERAEAERERELVQQQRGEEGTARREEIAHQRALELAEFEERRAEARRQAEVEREERANMHQLKRAELEVKHADSLRVAQETREERANEHQLKMADLEAKRADALREAQETRLDRATEREKERQKLDWDRRDELNRRKIEEERERWTREAKVDLLRRALERGAFDLNPNLAEIWGVDPKMLEAAVAEHAEEANGKPLRADRGEDDGDQHDGDADDGDEDDSDGR